MQINPMSMRVPTGRNLDGKAMAQFEAERDRIDALRAAQTKPLFASAAPAAKSADASGQRGLR
ncbi:MAG: hypothetical protein EBZ50_07685 [Alphaproteobacteria bacterium]|jgi:hypothetical protein|nr:hypothetical protein [Alphaproteobacteria bacterium]